MAGNLGWISFLTAVCLAGVLTANADVKLNPQVGQLFVYELDRKVYQNEFPPFLQQYGIVNDDSMVFKCSLQHFPDLPRWLRYTQRSPRHNGFLYGTPMPQDQGKAIIEVVVTNRQTYDTFRQKIMISVGAPVKRMPYQVEFFLPLRDVEEVLPPGVQDEVVQYAKVLWQTERLDVVNITSALDRGGRVPLPLPGHKEGVYIKLGSDRAFPECLRQLQNPKHQQECEQGMDPVPCAVWLSAHNRIDWCNTMLIDLSRRVPPPPVPTPGSGILLDDDLYDPPESPESRDFFPDYIGTVLVPFALALILCVILAYIMCCRREGVEERDTKTSDIQLHHHHTIHDNTDELRIMAGSRGVPRPLSTLPMFNARTGDRVPPLQRPFRSDSAHIPLILAQQDPNIDTLPR